MLVRPHNRGIDGMFLVGRRPQTRQGFERRVPHPELAPAREAHVHSIPIAVPFRHVAPGGAGAQHPQNAVDHAALVFDLRATLATVGEKSIENPPLRVRQIAATQCCLPQKGSLESKLDSSVKNRQHGLVLSLHHIFELLSHSDKRVVAERMSYLGAMPMLACVASAISGFVGSILDVLIYETGAAYEAPQADASSIRNAVAVKLFRLDSGADIVAPVLSEWGTLQAMFREQAIRNREIVAISRSGFAGVEKTKLRGALKWNLRSPEDATSRLHVLEQRLVTDIQTRGDKRIADPEKTAAAFLRDVRRHGEKLLSCWPNPLQQLLAQHDIEFAEITDGMTVGEVGELATFRQKLRVVNRTLGLPWPELKARVQENRLPSGIIQAALRKFSQDLPEYKGSELTDMYLACLSAYADITFVDKRTYENFRRARQKSPEFAAIVREVARAGDYTRIAERLADR